MIRLLSCKSSHCAVYMITLIISRINSKIRLRSDGHRNSPSIARGIVVLHPKTGSYRTKVVYTTSSHLGSL